MQKQPLVSVLMTAYNREKYIAEAIKSVLASSYGNLELLITDDRSTDNTFEIAKSFQELDKRVKVYKNEKNLGDYPNRNKAASYAVGKYLKYVDADDYIYPWSLEIMVQMMEMFPDAGWGLCSLRQNDQRPFPFVLSPKEAYLYNYTGNGLFHKAPLSSIIRRDVFIETGGFAEIRMAGDFEFWHRLGQKYPVVLMPDGMVWYRKHTEQEMKYHSEFASVYEKISLSYLKSELPLSKAESLPLLKKRRRMIYRVVARSIMTFKFSQASKMIRSLRSDQPS